MSDNSFTVLHSNLDLFWCQLSLVMMLAFMVLIHTEAVTPASVISLLFQAELLNRIQH